MVGGIAVAKSMKATIFVEPGRIELTERPIPDIGPLDALIRVTTTTGKPQGQIYFFLSIREAPDCT